MGNKMLRVLLLGLLFGLVAAPSAFADNVYAEIHGTVTDPSGAVVVGAQVTATNTQTGVSKTVTTDSNGYYQFLQLPVGPYSVSATKQGFKTFKSTALTLTVNQIYSLAVKLDVGQTSETVEVTAHPVQVETTNTQLNTVIGSQQITDLPLNGRNFTQLQQLAPGVMASNDRFGTFATNGSQTQQNSYLVNGTDSNDIPLNTPLQLPSPDAIQEFNLITSTINPEYGRNSGGIVNAVIKNGTNNWHGSIFDFYRDTFLNARSFFTVGPQQPIFHQNQFGGTFGGPIKKDKSFFFFSYQGTRNRTSNATLTSVFSPAERTGDFSGDTAQIIGNVLANGGSNVTPIQLVGDDNVSHPAGTPWFGTGTTGAILNCGNAVSKTVQTCSNPNFGKLGAGIFNSVAAGLMNNFVPLPNTTGNQFGFSALNTAKPDQYIARVDHNLTSSDQIWGVAFLQYNKTQEGLPFTGATLPGFDEIDTRNIYQYTASWSHTFTNAMLNEFRLGYSRFNFDAVEPLKPALPSSFGFTGINPQSTSGAGMPTIAVSGLFTLGFSDNGPQPRKDQTYQLTDNFLKIAGRHSLKFGFDGRRFQVDNPFFFVNNGHFDFGGGGTNSSLLPALDFLTGNPDDFIQSAGGIINARAYEYFLYGQDSWKASDTLTVNYGAAYQIDTSYDNNQHGGLAFNCFIPGQQSGIFPSAPNSLNFPGDPGCTKSGTTTKYGHIAPRFGFAWAPRAGWLSGSSGSKFSIRGGIGLYYNRTDEEGALQNLGAPPFGFQSTGAVFPSFADPFTDITGGASAPNPFPFTNFPKAGDPTVNFNQSVDLNGNPIPGLDINVINPNLTTPRSVNYNLNIQREFAANTVLTLGYVGSQGRHLYRAYEANPITFAGQAACAADPTCIAFRTIQHLAFPTHSLVSGTDFFSVGQQATDGNSHYNAFQVSVNKGMSHGLQLLTSYTWSHSVDNGSGFENSGFGTRGTNIFVPSLDVGDSAFDARQRLVLGYIYQIPSLHHFANWASDYIFGGWKITGITTFQTGFPINFADSGRRSLFCDSLSFYGCPDNPNQVVNTVNTLDPRTSTFNGKKDFWFDPASFARQAIGTFGNTRRDSLHGPGINNTDFALIKDTKIRENVTFEMGIEGFNVFNHTQFLNPVSNIASSNFGRITTAAAPRIFQLRGKFIF